MRDPAPTGTGLMGCERQADNAGPAAVLDVSNTWSGMSPGARTGRVPGLFVKQ